MARTIPANPYTGPPEMYPTMLPFGRWRYPLVTLWIALLAFSPLSPLGPAGARGDPPATSASHWGDIPAPSDSVTQAFEERGKPLWEKTLLVPYTLIGIPFSLLKGGFKGTVIFLDEKKVIYRIGQLVGPRRGPFGVLVNFRAGGLAGLGGGLSAVHDAFFSPENQFKLRWESTSRGSHRVNLGIRINDVRDPGFEFGAGYRIRPNARFFGIGPGTPKSMESYYTQEVGWVGLGRRNILPANLTAEGLILYSMVGARGPRDAKDYASIDTVFASAKPIGLRDRSDGFTFGLTLTHDTTAEDGRPEGAGTRQIGASFFQAMGGHPSFWTFRADVEQFLHLLFSKQVLALRGYITWLESSRSDEIPFQRLLTNDDPDLLRGYRDFRWRDLGLTAFSAEYRWPMWANKTADGLGLDAYLLADIGQVFGEFSQISLNTLSSSYGFGVRLIGASGFKGRVEVAWSDEDTVVRLRADQIFQFAKGGLFHGRDQVALR